MATEMVTLPSSAIADIRRMLTVGLAAMAEIERLRTEAELSEKGGQALPEGLRPVHPTGCEEFGDFSTALLWLEQAAPLGDKAGHMVEVQP